jgi:hypothetical protein
MHGPQCSGRHEQCQACIMLKVDLQRVSLPGNTLWWCEPANHVTSCFRNIQACSEVTTA